MILLAHPFGNANVRAILEALHEAGLLAKYFTTLGWSNERGLRAFWPRRGYEVPNYKIQARPTREIVRLFAAPSNFARSSHMSAAGPVSIRFGADLMNRPPAISARINATKKSTRFTRTKMRDRSLPGRGRTGRASNLPFADSILGNGARLLREEAERYPEWEPTLGGTRDSEEKLARKTRELELAELVICRATLFSILAGQDAGHEALRSRAIWLSHPCAHETHKSYATPLRVLFAGALTQRKGLADLFVAMKLVKSHDVELVVMGSLLRPLSWYRPSSHLSSTKRRAPMPKFSG